MIRPSMKSSIYEDKGLYIIEINYTALDENPSE
jgi:hypothetical protein